MSVPSFYTERPSGAGAAALAAFEQLWHEHMEAGALELDYRLTEPRWQFLCWLADAQGLLLHGGGSPQITEFEPRQSNDIGEFGNRKAVYAASDALWAMYFALVDRKQGSSLVNGCMHVATGLTSPARAYYFFSVDPNTLGPSLWRPGWVYVLPREGFESETEEESYGLRTIPTQWASATSATPLARVRVAPADFPLLKIVRHHDQATVFRRASSRPGDFPWLTEDS